MKPFVQEEQTCFFLPISLNFYHLQKKGASLVKISSHDKKFFFGLSLLVGLYLLPIILMDFPYADDTIRMIRGENGQWLKNGRVLSYLWYRLLSFSWVGLDVSPLPQIICGILLVISGFLLYKHFFSQKNLFGAVALAFLCVAQPFFLSNIIYKFDASMFGFSILLAVVALIYGAKAGRGNAFLSLCAFTASLLFYQASLPLFLGLTLCHFLLKYFTTTEDTLSQFKQLRKFAAIAIGGYVLYGLISKPFLSGWVAEISQPVSFSWEGLQQILFNFKKMNYRIFRYFFGDPSAILLFGIPMVLSCLGLFFSAFKNWRQGKLRFMPYLFFLSLPLALYIILLLPVLFFTAPSYVARILFGFLPISLFGFLGFLYLFRRYKKMSYLLVFPVLYIFTLDYSFANAEKAQKRFDTRLVNYITEDLKATHKIDNIHTFLILGQKPLPPERKVLEDHKPLLKWFIRDYLDEHRAYDLLKHFPIFRYVQKVYFAKDAQAQPLIEKSRLAPILAQNPLYTLKIVEDTAIVEYKSF